MLNKGVSIIAEIGINHNADFELACKMIEAAAGAGADIIKFQTAIPELVQTASAPKAKYQTESTGSDTTALEMSKGFHFALDVFPKLKVEVEKYDKRFLSTAFDLVSQKFLFNLGLKTAKIPSGEITNLPYLELIAQGCNEIILSTGMATMDEIKQAVQVFLNHGILEEQITLLQCNTAYPTPLSDANLNVLDTYKEEFGTQIGYSDHTPGFISSVVAVAKGATLIEKHFTLDKSLSGPDQKASLDPREFAELVMNIRAAEETLGSPIKQPTPSEIINKQMARRGVYFNRDMNVNELITADDLICLRPENEISPMRIPEITGHKLLKNAKRHDAVKSENLSL